MAAVGATPPVEAGGLAVVVRAFPAATAAILLPEVFMAEEAGRSVARATWARAADIPVAAATTVAGTAAPVTTGGQGTAATTGAGFIWVLAFPTDTIIR